MSFFSCARSLYYPGLPTEPLQITPRRSISALGFGFITQLYFPAIDNPTECDAEREPSNRQTNDCNEPQHYTSTRVAMPYPFVPIEATPDVSDPPPPNHLGSLGNFCQGKTGRTTRNNAHVDQEADFPSFASDFSVSGLDLLFSET